MNKEIITWVVGRSTLLRQTKAFHFGMKVAVSLYWLFFVGGIPLCIIWFFHLPLAGYAIGVLGAVGVFVALRGESKLAEHKPIWALMTLLLLVIEIQAIKKDRDMQLSQHAAEFTKQQKDSGDAASLNQQHFDATLGKMNEAIAQITGGDSCLLLKPNEFQRNRLDVLVSVNGKYTMRAVHVQFIPASGSRAFSGEPIVDRSLGDIAPFTSRILGSELIMGNESAQSFQVNTVAENASGLTWGTMDFARVGNKWATRYLPATGSKCSYTDPDFPKEFKLPPLAPNIN